SPEAIEHFCKVMVEIVGRMQKEDLTMKESPKRALVRRIDETSAARQPILNYFTRSA
ncbi:MAG: aminomethyl-transferring glycine dehydrogenase subunit GcvPB, partial [Spirochaetia bacterium]|nr:aminomethyl-transferring glycine dehydrogenase subunit GcvPB [Spirochaetia bacterium]